MTKEFAERVELLYRVFVRQHEDPLLSFYDIQNKLLPLPTTPGPVESRRLPIDPMDVARWKADGILVEEGDYDEEGAKFFVYVKQQNFVITPASKATITDLDIEIGLDNFVSVQLIAERRSGKLAN